MQHSTVVIDSKYCGPDNSGNGGYSCGLLAQFLPGPVCVRLLSPPPLDTALRVEYDSHSATLFNDDTEIARAKTASLDVAAPPPVTYAEAETAATKYIGFDAHECPRCFVCGPDRAEGDGLRIFAGDAGNHPGNNANNNLVAAPWRPHPSLCELDEDLATPSARPVKPIFLWSALDCAGAFSFLTDPKTLILLGELTAELRLPLYAEEACVITGQHLGSEGRKRFVTTAIYNQGGKLAALAKATWIELKSNA